MPRRRTHWFIYVCIALGVAAMLAQPICSLFRRPISIHIYPAASSITVLTDDEAIRVARQVMRDDGLSEQNWSVVTDPLDSTPGGTTKPFIGRDGSDPNRVLVDFVSNDHRERRYVLVEYRDGKLICELGTPK